MKKQLQSKGKEKKTKMNSQGFKHLKGNKTKEKGPQQGPFRPDRTKHNVRKPIKGSK